MTGNAPFVIRPARPRDARAVLGLLEDATDWLADRGLDQWQGSATRREEGVRCDIAVNALWVVTQHGRVVATITVDHLADTDFWRPTDRVRSALYVHRMAVARSHTGRNLGAAMLDWAAERVVRSGRTLLRLDAWSTNEDLHQYYKNLDFAMVRNVPVPGRGSGALFERPAFVRSGLGPRLRPPSAAMCPAHLAVPPGRRGGDLAPRHPAGA